MAIEAWQGWRRWRPSPAVVDLLVALAVAVPVVLDSWWNKEGTRQADPLTYGLAAVSVAALVVRRRWPVAVAVVCGGAATAWYVLGHHGEVLNLPTMVALYTVADLGDRRRSLVAGAVAVSWSGLVTVVVDRPAGAPGSAPMLELVWPVVALLLGEVIRSRRELLAEYVERAALAETERERESRLRVEEERLRIARELHDVVAHTVTAMNVQAGLAIEAFEARPDLARQALAQVRTSGREAVDELHAVVAVLRADGTGASQLPAPGFVQLDELVATVARSGLAVDLRVGPGVRDVPTLVGLAGYRIVQEALTNVIRHAHAEHVTVTVSREPDVVRLEVVDDGLGPSSSSAGPGPTASFGLLGMAERAAAVGGCIDHGRAPGGGFRVCAVLPFGRGER